MDSSCYLVLNDSGIVRMKKKLPALAGGEVAVKVTVSVDDSFFQKLIPEAVINVPADLVMTPELNVTVEIPGEE